MRTLLTQKLLPMFLLAAFLTACPIVTAPPPTPLGLSATATSSTGIQVSWVASLGATSYTLERSTGASAFVGVGGKITTTTFADSSLQGATKYTYRVKAVNDAGTSDPSAEVSETTPTDLVSLQATATSSTTVNLSWNAVAGATGYTLERKAPSGTYSTVSTPTNTSFSDTSLTPNTTFTYRVTAQPIGQSAAGEKAVTTFPGNPTNVTSSSAASSVTLNWTKPLEGGTYTYTVERKQGSGAYSLIGSPSASPFNDSSATPGVTYTYRIKAVSNGVSSSGVEVNGGAQLATPTNFTSSGLTATKVTLSWTAVPGATSYTLTRQLNSGSFNPLTITSSTNYTDSTITSGNVYTYRLLATNGSVFSPTADTSVSLTPIKVLFIGNSLTFVNSVPLMIQTLANNAGELHPFQFEMVVKAGASLSYHYPNTTDPSPGAGAAIQNGPASGGDWDFVVLQELSVNPVCDQSSFNTNGKKFATDIKTYNPNAKVILHQNWVVTDTTIFQSCGAYFSTPLDKLVANTNALADSINPVAKIVPVGQAWANYGSSLLQSDGLHPTPEGSYLAAATYYALLYNKSPAGLTNQVKANTAGVIDPNPALLSNYTVNSSTANTLQTNAWNAVQGMAAKYRLP
jgi:fibronectin type 3 domain-containing protein